MAGRIFADWYLQFFPALHFSTEKIAQGMLKADERLFKARYRDSILAAFVEKGILRPAHAVKGVQKVELQSATGDAKLLSEIKLPENKNEAASTNLLKKLVNCLVFQIMKS